MSMKGAEVYDAYRYGVGLLQVPWLRFELNFLKLARGETVPNNVIVSTGLVASSATYVPLRAGPQLLGRCLLCGAVKGDRRLRHLGGYMLRDRLDG